MKKRNRDYFEMKRYFSSPFITPIKSQLIDYGYLLKNKPVVIAGGETEVRYIPIGNKKKQMAQIYHMRLRVKQFMDSMKGKCGTIKTQFEKPVYLIQQFENPLLFDKNGEIHVVRD